LYRTYIKRKGRFEIIAEGLSRGAALQLGSRVARRTLAATFKVEPTKEFGYRKETKFTPSKQIFRSYKIVKGKKEPLKDVFIQRRGKRLLARTEVGAIQMARRRAIT